MILPERVLTGPGKLAELPAEARRFGPRGILIHGRAADNRAADLPASAPSDLTVTTFRHHGGEPTLDQVDELRGVVRESQAQWVAAVGGGSVIDLAKAAALLARASGPTVVYHDGTPVECEGLPFLAVPTTAGTGSEATINTVLTNTQTGAKKSIRDPRMMARVVILDPRLLATCPPAVIAASGLDAFTQAVEAYTSRGATAFSDGLALQGLGLVAGQLEAVFRDAHSAGAGDLLAGSFITGVALSFARLGVVHGLAHPLGSLYHAPHGLVCAICLPHAIAFNRDAMGVKYQALSAAVGMDLLDGVAGLNARLGLRSPFAGQPVRSRDALIAETLASGSTKSNPRPVTRADVEWFLDRLFA